jgi:hypothetical protein
MLHSVVYICCCREFDVFPKTNENTRRWEKLLHEKKMIALEQRIRKNRDSREEIDGLKNEKLTSEN